MLKDFHRILRLKPIQKVCFHFMFSSEIARVSTRVCSKFSKRVKLKLGGIAVKRLTVVL